MKSVKSKQAKAHRCQTPILFDTVFAQLPFSKSISRVVQPLCPEVPPPTKKYQMASVAASVKRPCSRNRAVCAGPGVSSTLPSGCSITRQVLQQERNFYALRNCLCVFLMMIPTLYLTSRGGTCWRSFNFTLRCNYDEMCVNSNVSGLKHPVIYYGLSRMLINYYVLSF